MRQTPSAKNKNQHTKMARDKVKFSKTKAAIKSDAQEADLKPEDPIIVKNADSEPEPKPEKKTKAKSKKSDSEAESEADAEVKPKTKRAPSAYNIYIKDKIAELRISDPGLKPQEYMKMAVAEYNIEHPKPENEEKPKKERKPRQKKADKAEKEEKPKKERKPRAPTGYNIFIKEAMAELKESGEEMKPQERMKKAVEMWHKLTPEEKASKKIVKQEVEVAEE